MTKDAAVTPTFDEFLRLDRYGKKNGYTAMYHMGWRRGGRADGDWGWTKTLNGRVVATGDDPQFIEDASTCYRQAYGAAP